MLTKQQLWKITIDGYWWILDFISSAEVKSVRLWKKLELMTDAVLSLFVNIEENKYFFVHPFELHFP